MTLFSACIGHIILDSSECDNELFYVFCKALYWGRTVRHGRSTDNYPINIQTRQFVEIFCEINMILSIT